MPKKPTPASATPKRSVGRPKGKTPPIPNTGVRIPPELLARVDRVVERREKELARRGGHTSRSAVINAALEEMCAREEAAELASQGT